MPKLDSAIYGSDDTAAANAVSAAALSAGDLGRDVADNNASIQDERAQSYANVGRESLGPSGPRAPLLRSKLDAGNRENEALNMPEDYKIDDVRHRPGPRTSRDEGAAVGEAPPRFVKAPGKSAGPAYAKKKS